MFDCADQRIVRTLFVSLWLLYACIGPGTSANDPNTVSRMAFVFSVIQRHTLTIDSFADNTEDKARFGGHYYLDKAPGQSFTTLPFAAAVELAARAVGADVRPVVGRSFTPYFVRLVWFGCLVTSSAFTAAAAAMLYRLAREWHTSRQAALFGTLVYAVCTPALGWATVFFGHGMAGACLFMGFALVMLASNPASPQRSTIRTGFLAGAVLGWSVVVEFTAAPAALIIAGLGCWRLQFLPPAERARLIAAVAGGASVAALPLAIYNALAFGSPFHIAYGEVVGFAGMQTGFFGVSLPRAEVLLELLAGTKRGILWLSPILLLLPFAWTAAFRRFGAPVALALAAIPITFLLINSGYAYWDGGFSTGPRHLTPSLPFVGLAVAALWQSGGPRVRVGLLALAQASFALSLICASVSMICPLHIDGVPIADELFGYLLPQFLAGNVHNLLAPAGNGGMLSLLVPLSPVLLEVVGSGVVPLLHGESRSCRQVLGTTS